MKNKPQAVIFDLDDTLAESFQRPKPEMIVRLEKLLELVPVSILTAAGFPRIETQFLDALAISPHIERLYIFPNSASQCYMFENGGWRLEYSLTLTPEERAAITQAINESVAETAIIEPDAKYSPMIIDREAQIAYAAVGLEATEEDKKAWDPDQAKRKKLKDAIEKRLPDFEVLIGGKTTIDITRKGITKAHGIEWLSKRLGMRPDEMLFVGDALYEGGNDFVVIPTGVQTHSVKDPNDTLRVIDEILASFET